jgi:hypothetical protein
MMVRASMIMGQEGLVAAVVIVISTKTQAQVGVVVVDVGGRRRLHGVAGFC